MQALREQAQMPLTIELALNEADIPAAVLALAPLAGITTTANTNASPRAQHQLPARRQDGRAGRTGATGRQGAGRQHHRALARRRVLLACGRTEPWNSQILTIAGKEFRDRMRNRWVLAVALVFTVFSPPLPLFGGAQQGTVGFRSIEFTIASLVSLVIYLIPLIALLLGFDAIVASVSAARSTCCCPAHHAD